MRIVLIGPVYPYRGGIAHYTTLLAQRLQSAGHVVKIISFRRQYPGWLYPGETDKDTSQQALKAPADYLLDPLYPWTWFSAARSAVRDKPDLVIISWWTTFWAPAFAVLTRRIRAAGVPLTYLVHNVMPHDARPWDRWLAALALSPVRSFIVQTEKEAARLRTLLRHAQPVIVPHPIYNMFSNQVLPQADARARLNLPQDASVLLFFGIVRPYKGLKYLLEALALLHQKGQQIHLVVAGEFWEPESIYTAQATSSGINEYVHIFNTYIPNEDVPVFFSAADLFVAPYIDGTQSGAVKMALGFGLPVVLTDCIVDETLSGRPGVWSVPEHEARALAETIEEALSNLTTTRLPDAPDDWGRMVKAIEAIPQAASAVRGARKK
jgi:glycosyltransferase involved in cell wall biosynthesis